MAKIKAVIIDDNEEARTSLADDINRYCPEIEISGEAHSVRSGIKVLSKQNPDLVFLDIHLTDGDGFEILRELDDYKFKVIFTTGSGDYALKAIKISALDYLLKPVDPDELIAAVNKLKISSEKENISSDKPDNSIKENLDILIENIKNIPATTTPKRIALSSADRVHFVNINDIIRCESQRNYTLFYLTGNKQILVTRTLKEFDEMLEDKGFIRIHHSHLINLNYLKEFVKADGGYALMSDNSQIPVAVRKKDELMKKLGL